MSGDTHTCGVHLDGAGQLISFLWNKKKSLSDKTRSLYSIYCYLRVIYESTLVQRPNEPTQRELRSESVFQYFDKINSDGGHLRTRSGDSYVRNHLWYSTASSGHA
jgi:hypothetical protein